MTVIFETRNSQSVKPNNTSQLECITKEVMNNKLICNPQTVRIGESGSVSVFHLRTQFDEI